MNQKLLAIGAALLSMGLLFGLSACTKEGGINIPAPRPVDEVIPDDDEDDGGGGGGEDSGTLCTDIGQTPVILAYYTENSKALPDPTLLTHINYAHGRFGNPSTGDGGIVISDTGLMQKVIALKDKNPRLKVLLMVGGWGMRADGFSMMARDAGKRTAFCQSLKAHLDNYGLDGVDIDWEYPTYSAEGTGASAYDTQNFNLVLKELRETIGTSKIISFASSSSAKYVDWPTAIQYIDYVNVMTYDMGAAPNGHNSPLYRSAKFNHRSCDESIDLHAKAGIPLNRMNLGIPFYGKAEKNPSPDRKVYDYEVNYNEMDNILNKNWYAKRSIDVTGKNNRAWDDVAKVPFLTNNLGYNLLSYDDPESVGYKGAYVLEKKLLGAMFWEYRHDDDKQSLLRSLVRSVYGKESVME